MRKKYVPPTIRIRLFDKSNILTGSGLYDGADDGRGSFSSPFAKSVALQKADQNESVVNSILRYN